MLGKKKFERRMTRMKWSRWAKALPAALGHKGMQRLDRKAVEMGLGHPLVARELRERYSSNRSLQHVFRQLEWLGPLKPETRHRLAREFFTADGRLDLEKLEVAAGIMIESKVENALNEVKAALRERRITNRFINEVSAQMMRELPMLSLGASYCFPYMAMDKEGGVGKRFFVVRRTARGFEVREQAEPPWLKRR